MSTKAIICITLITASSVAMADISLGTGASAPGTQENGAAEARDYIHMAQEVLSVVKELSGVLGGVTDQASADAAAPQITGLTTRMIELQKKAEGLPRPTAEVEQQVRASMNLRDVQQVVASLLDSFIRIGKNNGYGSQALMNSISPVLNAMPGKEE